MGGPRSGWNLIEPMRTISQLRDRLSQSQFDPIGYRIAVEGLIFDPQGKLAGWTNGARKIEAQTAVGALFDNNNKSITAYSFGQDKQLVPTADDVYGYRLFKLGNQGSIK
jgi:hypothetical protein